MEIASDNSTNQPESRIQIGLQICNSCNQVLQKGLKLQYMPHTRAHTTAKFGPGVGAGEKKEKEEKDSP